MTPSAKTRSALSETPPNKTSPATPRVIRPARGPVKSGPESPSPLQTRRLTVDRSPKTVESKTATDRRSPKLNTPSEKQQTVSLEKESELKVQIGLLQEDLKKVNEQLVSLEKEKAQYFEDLKEAKRSSHEANEKLTEALLAQKRAEENIEIEKFRADELEQVGIEAAQRREEEWQNEIEAVRNQHNADIANLLSVTQELQRVSQELAITTEAKNAALHHADEAMKIAEINAEKVEILSGEVNELKLLLDSEPEVESDENLELIKSLSSEVNFLKQKLEKAKSVEEKAKEMEIMIEDLRNELTDAHQSEIDASNLVDEWKKKVCSLEIQIDELKQSEKSTMESISSTTKQLEASNVLLQDAESEISSLGEKVVLLEISLERHKSDYDESSRHLEVAKQEIAEMETTIELLKSELRNAEEEKTQALNNEKLAAMNVQSLLEEKNKLMDELEASKEEEEKNKKAMESLASALHEASIEIRDAKEEHSMNQAELENIESQVKDLKSALQRNQEKYEMMLCESKEKADSLENVIRELELEAHSSRVRWDEKEAEFLTATKNSQEEFATIKDELSRLVNLLRDAEEEAQVAKEDAAQLMIKLKQMEEDTASVKQMEERDKAEILKLRERLLDKENELQNITQENDDLRLKEAIALEKVEELSKLLEEAEAKKPKENGDLSTSEKENDLSPEPEEFTVENENENKNENENVKLSTEFSFQASDDKKTKLEVENCNHENFKGEEVKNDMEHRKPENCNVVEKNSPPRKDPESELESKLGSGGYDQINGSSLETIDDGRSQQKKKKPLLRKFGSLLKKKGSNK